MAGLDVIVGKIDAKATSDVEQINAKSASECKEILDQAKIEAEKIEKVTLKYVEDVKKDIMDRSISQAKLKVRQEILSFKQELIKNTIKKAKEKIYAMSDKEYFDILEKIIQKYVTGDVGEIIMSSKDLSRIPADFESKISKVAKQKGGDLKISKQVAAIKGGFILKYQKIEENCSIEALFDNSYDDLVDKVHEVLFS